MLKSLPPASDVQSTSVEDLLCAKYYRTCKHKQHGLRNSNSAPRDSAANVAIRSLGIERDRTIGAMDAMRKDTSWGQWEKGVLMELGERELGHFRMKEERA